MLMEREKTVEISEAARMLEKKRILYDVEEAYRLQVEDFNQELKEFCKQEDMIKQKDFLVQKKLIKVAKHLIENKNKKIRAERRFNDERAETEKVERDIEKMKHELEILEEHRKIFDKKITNLQKFEDFLRIIVQEHQDQYTDVGDFLQRFRVLEQNNKHLKKLQYNIEQKNNSLSLKLLSYEKNKLDQIMILNNEIANLQSNLEKMEQNNLRYFSAIGNINYYIIDYFKYMNFEKINKGA